MLKPVCIALALMSGTSAFSQQPAAKPLWSLDGLVMMTGRIPTKTQDDHENILRVTGQKPEELRIARIRTPAGHVFIVQGLGQQLCSSQGNCSSWVLDQNYHVLLTTNAESFRLQASEVPGQLDVVTYQHGAGNFGNLKRWQLDGHAYRSISCASLTLVSAGPKQPMTPNIQPTPCTR